MWLCEHKYIEKKIWLELNELRIEAVYITYVVFRLQLLQGLQKIKFTNNTGNIYTESEYFPYFFSHISSSLNIDFSFHFSVNKWWYKWHIILAGSNIMTLSSIHLLLLTFLIIGCKYIIKSNHLYPSSSPKQPAALRTIVNFQQSCI